MKKVAQTNHDLQKVGGKILRRHREVLTIRRQQKNINTTVSRLATVLPVLGLFISRIGACPMVISRAWTVQKKETFLQI